MSKPKGTPDQSRPMRPALTPEARESQLISQAYNLVEQRLRDGTASSQETTYFLKRGSEKEKLEVEKVREENKLLRAKTESLQSASDVKALYEDAIKAMRNYSGQDDEDDY